MNISSAQTNYSITSSDTITLTSTGSGYTSDVITIDLGGAGGSSSNYYIGGGIAGSGVSTITLTGGSGAGAGGFVAQDISAIDPNIFTWKTPEEFVDCLPNIERINNMCKEYPGLKIAYEKFVTTYRLVKDDYDAPPEKKIKP